MLSTIQTFVQRRYHTLLMGFIGLGFVLLFAELIGYEHYHGFQVIGLATTIIGVVTAFTGIAAKGKLRFVLASIFLVLSLAGLLGLFFHNEDRLGLEQRPPAGQFPAPGQGGAPPIGDNQTGQPTAGTTNPQNQATPATGQELRQPGARPGGRARPMGPPPLAPLSLSGFCALGMVALLGKKDEAL